MVRKIEISPELSQRVPELKLACIECDIELQDKNLELWIEIEEKIKST